MTSQARAFTSQRWQGYGRHMLWTLAFPLERYLFPFH